jgi:hypothetical protein
MIDDEAIEDDDEVEMKILEDEPIDDDDESSV